MSPTNESNNIELECECHVCNGAGGWTREETGDWRDCGVCKGSGYLVTAFGEKVLALMRHNFRPMLQDAQSD